MDDVDRGCHSAAERIKYYRNVEEDESPDEEVRAEESAHLQVALVRAHVAIPAGEVEHQGEADDEVDYREAIRLDHEAHEDEDEGEIRQHVRCQRHEDVVAAHRPHLAEVFTRFDIFDGFRVEFGDFAAQKQCSDKEMGAFVGQGVDQMAVFLEEKSREEEERHHAYREPEIALIGVGFE